MSKRDMPKPEGTGQRPITLLDTLLFIRKQVDQGRPLWFFLGEEPRVQSLVAFIAGYRAACHYNSIDDAEYTAFMTWLRDERHDMPSEGWAHKYLEDCEGDHEHAIRQFLARVEEYTSQRR